ncbi:hypothetical protein Tco_0830753 [Tanacetum coccineum]
MKKIDKKKMIKKKDILFLGFSNIQSHVESTDDEDSDEEIKGANIEGDKQDEEETNKEVEANELYMDVNINLVGRDTEMTDAPRTIIQTTQVIEDTHAIITLVNPEGQQQSSSVSSGFVSNMLNPSLDTCIDSIFNLNTESTSQVDVPVTAIAEQPFLSAITLPPPPTPLITHLQQTPVPTSATAPSSLLLNLPNFDNDGDNFVHPKLLNQDQVIRHNEEESDEESQGTNVEEEELDEEETNNEDKVNELYRDVNVNLEGRDIEMTDAQQTNVQTTQVIEDTHVIINPVNPEGQQHSSSVSSGFISNMLNPSPDTGIDSIFNRNTDSTSLIDVLVTTIAEPPLLSTTTLPPPATPLITHLQQTPVTTPATVLSSFLQDLPNFSSLFGFDHRLKTLENNFSEFNQTNQFSTTVSSIPGIVDAYLANKMHEAVKIVVQLQYERLRDEAQAENVDLINKLDDNIKKIIKDQVKEQVKTQVSKILPKIKKTINEQLEAEVLTRSSNESKTSHAVAANLFKLELKKILIDKMESNKSIHRSDAQKNLYKALVDAYESDKLILDTYGETVSFKRHRDEEDKDEEPSAGSNRGSKRRRAGKEPELTSTPKENTSKTTGKSTEGSKSHHKSADESAQAEEPMQTGKDLEESAHQEFDTGVTEDQPDEETSQLLDWFQKPAKPPTPDPFVMNRLKVDTLTPELLAGLTFELMKGSCKSLVELEYFFEEVYKATTDQLDWNNPEGQQDPHDLRKPLPLISNSRGRHVIPFDHFINNDLVYLSGGVSSRTYTTSVTKTKAADYKNIKWIEDLVPNIIIIAVTKLQIVEWHNYKHLDWITVCKLTNLTVEERLAFNVSLRMFTRSVVIQRRVEDLQLGVESYQKKLNLTKPDTYRSDLKRREAFTTYSNPRGFIYQNKDKKNKLMRIDELHKFSDGTLNDVRTALDDRLKGIQMKYLPQPIWRQSDRDKAGAMIQIIDKQLKTRRIMRSLEKFIGGRPYEGDFQLLQRTI